MFLQIKKPFIPKWDERLNFRGATQIAKMASLKVLTYPLDLTFQPRLSLLSYDFGKKLRDVLQYGLRIGLPPPPTRYDYFPYLLFPS